MGKLQLYLKGGLFQEMDIQLPADQDLSEDEKRNFELNCQLRMDLVEAEATKFKLLYLRQIIKCGFEYEIYLVITKEIDEYNLMAH